VEVDGRSTERWDHERTLRAMESDERDVLVTLESEEESDDSLPIAGNFDPKHYIVMSSPRKTDFGRGSKRFKDHHVPVPEIGSPVRIGMDDEEGWTWSPAYSKDARAREMKEIEER